MARQLTFKIGRQEFAASPVRVDRRKLYGWTELMAVDDSGRPCELLTTDETGKSVIPLGGTANGILSDKGRWVERSELVTVDEQGDPARLYPSSFDTVNELKDKVTAGEYLDYTITDFYQLTDAPPQMIKAVGRNIFRFEYTYNDSYDPSPAFVLAAGGTLFLLVGEKNGYDWLCFGDCEMIDDEHDDRLIQEGDEDLDFSMF